MPYKKYKNLSKRSGVESYNNKRGNLTIEFKDGSLYEYTNKSAGSYAMKRMRQLAKRGKGLNGYINKSVKKNYSASSNLKVD